MPGKIAFSETERATITVLVDNRADLIVKSTRTVKHFTKEPLLAEHGFAALIDLEPAGIRILWDSGLTPLALLENMKRMKIRPTSIDKIALSHGHYDHTSGVTEILRAMDLAPKPKKWKPGVDLGEIERYVRGRRVQVIAHPAAFRERWGNRKDGTMYGPVLPPPRAEWEAAGAEIILSEEPYQLSPGCWTTGSVPRMSFETSGRPKRITYRTGDAFFPDDLEEDQAIAINVKDKGLVIVSGCAHSGIVNTVNHSREISGVDRVWAILGGFHLARASDEEIQSTVDRIKECEPAMIAPTHCTGFKAMCEFARQMPDVFVPGVAGAKYLF
jgi:7,8-dihydropterin-6-yl-methyl-4-(beta-D-ribofuranosyl)aminobenzene 5'-phosphate synthase